MEQGHMPGQGSVPENGAIDKLKVFDVKPLRSVIPVFPSAPSAPSLSGPQGAAPFICVSPAGPFPRGVTPFYPFHAFPTAQSISNTFWTPESTGAANGGVGSSSKGSKRRAKSQASEEDGDGDFEGAKSKSRKNNKATQGLEFASEIDTEPLIENILTTYNLKDSELLRRPDGDNESVGLILLVFDLLRRNIAQIEELKEGSQVQLKRPDLKAGAVLMNKGIRTNSKKRIGSVPGVEIGDIFYFRMEMCVVGLHAPSMAGIDFMSLKLNQEEESLAVSIVSSGGYEDDADDEDMLIYTGQGGNKSTDQKLERGNLALEKSLHRGNEVRVVRGMRDVYNPTVTARIYMYDGLYKIQESWVEKGHTGCNVFKYKLVRLPGQPDAFKVWKLVQQWRDGVVPRVGLILADISSGVERLPVSLVNDVDDEKGPAYFTYVPSLKYSTPVNAAEPYVGCSCKAGCVSGSENCLCIQKDGGYLPYIVNGVVVDKKSLIYECGSSCQCPQNCRNRLSQTGLKVRLEVFRTKNKGWGLRSWDPIRAGTFICEYAGEVISNSDAQRLREEIYGNHIFDGTRQYQSLEGLPGNCYSFAKLPFPLIITAKDTGNVARFMNHSCSPNVLWQPVLRAHSKELDLHIAFHAIRHIPPMTELTYDYGMVTPDKAHLVKKRCSCGSPKCRGFFY